MSYQKVAFALFLTDIKVSNVPFEIGLEVGMEQNRYFTDIAFDTLLATSTHFDNPTLKALALKAGYATHEAKFESIMQTIKEAEINLLMGVDPIDCWIACYMPYTYLMSGDMDKWTQSHDGGRRYEAMTTNISECFNGVLKGARSLPIAAMVEFTWCKLVAYFHDRHKQITSDLSLGKVWSDYAMEIYNKNEQKIAGHTLRNFNHEEGVYQVVIHTTTIEVEGETTIMKCAYLLEHVVAESGKT